MALDPQLGMFAMAFLDPAEHPVWKGRLLEGLVEPATAAETGRVLARLHAASAGNPKLAEAFDTYDNFYALRLEPYLLMTADRHPDLAAALSALAERTGRARIALVHGDVSPKNILLGPYGPVLLDAECAWYGDPAFDLAFCLNHLLLKCLVQPAVTTAYLTAFTALKDVYLEGSDWEDLAELEARAAALLPALLLARIDGKSPVEYLTDAAQKALVREAARPMVATAPRRLAEVAERWCQHLRPLLPS